MSEPLQLAAFALGYLLVLSAVGVGPILALAPKLPARLALAPIVGFALAASLLTSAAVVLPMRVAAWLVLVPAAVASVAWAVLARRQRAPARVDVLIPAGFSLAALVMALAPGFARGTLGPISLAVYDAWGYIQTDAWMQKHPVAATVPAADRLDLSTQYGHAAVSGHIRIGVSAVNGGVSSLFGVAPDRTHLALLATLFALVPLVVWVAARSLGAGRPAAAFGALFGLSPAILSLVGDSALANLAGVVLAPAALLVALRAIVSGRAGELVLAGVLGGGLVSVYPEFLPSAIGVAGIAVAGAVFRALLVRRLPPGRISTLPVRIFAVAAVVILVAPVGTARAAAYISSISAGDSALFAGLPARGLTLENAGAWAFGILHIYQLPRFDALSPTKTTFALALPLALAALVALGSVRRRLPLATALVAAPILVAVGFGLLAYRRYQGGHCEYCLWKSLTFMLPFLAVGVALGSERASRLVPARHLGRVGLVALAAATSAAIAWADVRLTQALIESPAAVLPELREAADALDTLAPAAPVLLEGLDAKAIAPWSTPAMYYFVSRDREGRVVFATSGFAPAYLGVPPAEEIDDFYSPAYRYVLSAFPGVRSDRSVVSRHGSYALYRRAPLDIAVVRTGWSLDPAEGEEAIPWIQEPFELLVSSAHAKRSRLELEVERPLEDLSTLVFHRGGTPLRTVRSAGGARLCVDVDLARGTTSIDVVPYFATTTAGPGRSTESDPFPPPPKVLGLAAVRAEPGRCRRSTR